MRKIRQFMSYNLFIWQHFDTILQELQPREREKTVKGWSFTRGRELDIWL